MKTKAAVIGVGRWGQKHVDEYSQLPQVDLEWVSDLNQEHVDYCKQTYKVPNGTTNYQDIIESDVDLINICSINETHYEICKAALEAHKHVFVEKPLTLKSTHAYELVTLAQEMNKQLAVGHIFRFNNALKETKTLIQNGFFDPLYYLRLQWTNHDYPTNPIEIISDIMPHVYDIMNFLLDSWPTSIFCYAQPFRIPKLYDTSYIICEFPNNKMTHTEISWTLPGKKRHVDVVGKDHCVKIECLDQKAQLFEEGKYSKDLPIQPNNTLRDELLHFLDAIHTNTALINSGEKGAKVVELIEHTHTSLQKQKTITIS